MLKKYIGLYKESVQTAVAFPWYALFLGLVNLPILLNIFPLSGSWELPLFLANGVLQMLALGGAGYVVIKLLRTGKAPENVWTHGVLGNFGLMVKYMLFQLFLVTLAWFLPVSLLEKSFIITPLMRTFWFWFVEFVFIFFIFEGIFWEDKGLMAGYRMRNVYMLDRFEWVFLVYVVVKLPHIILEMLPYWGWDWLLNPWGVAIIFVAISMLDWVNMLFSFKVFGEDRLQIAQEMDERVKEMEKQRRKGKRKGSKK